MTSLNIASSTSYEHTLQDSDKQRVRTALPTTTTSHPTSILCEAVLFPAPADFGLSRSEHDYPILSTERHQDDQQEHRIRVRLPQLTNLIPAQLATNTALCSSTSSSLCTEYTANDSHATVQSGAHYLGNPAQDPPQTPSALSSSMIGTSILTIADDVCFSCGQSPLYARLSPCGCKLCHTCVGVSLRPIIDGRSRRCVACSEMLALLTPLPMVMHSLVTNSFFAPNHIYVNNAFRIHTHLPSVIGPPRVAPGGLPACRPESPVPVRTGVQNTSDFEVSQDGQASSTQSRGSSAQDPSLHHVRAESAPSSLAAFVLAEPFRPRLSSAVEGAIGDPITQKPRHESQSLLMPSQWPVVALTNVPREINLDDILRWLPPAVLPPQQEQPVSIHFVKAQKQLQIVYLQLADNRSAQAVLNNTRAFRYKGGQLRIFSSSHSELLGRIFPISRGNFAGGHEYGCMPTEFQHALDRVDRSVSQFLTRKAGESLRWSVCQSNESPLSIEKAYLAVASVGNYLVMGLIVVADRVGLQLISLYPWQAACHPSLRWVAEFCQRIERSFEQLLRAHRLRLERVSALVNAIYSAAKHTGLLECFRYRCFQELWHHEVAHREAALIEAPNESQMPNQFNSPKLSLVASQPLPASSHHSASPQPYLLSPPSAYHSTCSSSPPFGIHTSPPFPNHDKFPSHAKIGPPAPLPFPSPPWSNISSPCAGRLQLYTGPPALYEHPLGIRLDHRVSPTVLPSPVEFPPSLIPFDSQKHASNRRDSAIQNLAAKALSPLPPRLLSSPSR